MAITPDQLGSLVNAVPDINKQAQAQAQAARQIQLQSAVAGAPATPAPAADTAAQLATSNAAAQTNIGLQGMKQGQQAAAEMGNAALTNQAATQQASQANREIAQTTQLTAAKAAESTQLQAQELASRKQITQNEIESAKRVQMFGMVMDNNLQMLTLKQRDDVAKLGRDVKQQIFDERLQFANDEEGRKFTNNRQLADYAVLNAKTNQDFNLRMQQLQQSSDRKVQLLQAAQTKIEQQIKENFASGEAAKDFEQQKRLLILRQEAQLAINKAKADANNTRNEWAGGGAIVGAVAGGVIAGVFSGGAATPAGVAGGAVVGSAVGGGLGTIVGGMQAKNDTSATTNAAGG